METLVLRHQEKAIRTAFLIAHDEPLAHDVVQEAFLQVYRRIEQFDETRPFEPYFLRSVVNAALNAVKATAKQISLDDDLSQVENLLSQVASKKTEVESRQFKAEILSALLKFFNMDIGYGFYLEMVMAVWLVVKGFNPSAIAALSAESD